MIEPSASEWIIVFILDSDYNWVRHRFNSKLKLQKKYRSGNTDNWKNLFFYAKQNILPSFRFIFIWVCFKWKINLKIKIQKLSLRKHQSESVWHFQNGTFQFQKISKLNASFFAETICVSQPEFANRFSPPSQEGVFFGLLIVFLENLLFNTFFSTPDLIPCVWFLV